MSVLGTGVINQGRHIGLQQLEALAAATHAFLGPNKAYKFIQDDASEEAALVCSCYRLLEQLELRDSVGQLLYETTRSHQEALHSGTSTLVFLAGVWSKVALDCLHKGILIPHIIAGMSKGLDLCVEACMRNAVTVEEVVCKGALLKQPSGGDCMKPEDGLPPELSLTTGGKESSQNPIRMINNLESIKETLPTKHRIKLKHSRHFTSSSNEAEGTQSAETLCQKSSKTFNIVQLAEAVSHGCESSMSLVVEASRIQSRHGKHKDQSQVLDVERLVTCPLPGLSEEHSCVLHGYVLLLCVEQASLVKRLKERTLKISLMNGDLSENYRHVGFNRPKNITYVSDCSSLTGISREQEWIDGALGKLLKLRVDVLLVSGVVTAQLKDHCLIHNILVIERVKANILKDFAMTTGAIPISYITQLSERCVGSGVCVNVLREYRGEGKTENILLNVIASGTSLVTAVIASSVHAKLQSMVDQFWSCAYRLHLALKDGKLLPGAGAAELLCIHQLYKCIDMSRSTIAGQGEAARAPAPYETTILQLMADSWMDYISTLMVNAGQVVAKVQAWTRIAQHLKDFERRSSLKNEMPETLLKTYFYTKALRGEKESEGDRMVEREREMVRVYDNVTVKSEAWRRALDLVFLILQTDTEIIVGINEQESQHRDVMFL